MFVLQVTLVALQSLLFKLLLLESLQNLVFLLFELPSMFLLRRQLYLQVVEADGDRVAVVLLSQEGLSCHVSHRSFDLITVLNCVL